MPSKPWFTFLKKPVVKPLPKAFTEVPVNIQTSQMYRTDSGEVWQESNAWNITSSKVAQMLQSDAIVNFGYAMLTLALTQASIQVLGDDEAEEQKDYLKESMIDSEIAGDFIEKLRYAPAYGFEGLELCWQIDRLRNLVLPRTPRLLRWPDVHILEEPKAGSELGSFAGVKYQNRGGNNREIKIFTKDNKVSLLTWGEALAQGSRYGYAQLTPAYEPWRIRRYGTYQDLARYLEKHANPALIGTFPEGERQDKTKTKIDNGTAMYETLKKIQQGARCAIPYEGAGPDGSGQNMWSIEPLNVPDRTALYENANRILSADILRALLVPERAVVEGVFGTKAEAETHGEILGMVQDAMMQQVLRCINNYVTQPLLRWNFGNRINPTVKLGFNTLVKRDAALTSALINKLVDALIQGNPIPQETADEIYRLTRIKLPADFKVKTPIDFGTKPVPSVPGSDDVKSPAEKIGLGEKMHRETEEWEDPRETLILARKGELKLYRKPTEDELYYRSEQGYVDFLTRQLESESELIDEIEGKIELQRKSAEKFVRNLWAKTQDSPTKRMQEIKNFSLRNPNDIRKLIKEWMTGQTTNAAEEAFAELGATDMWPGMLSGRLQAWIMGESDRIISKLTTDVESNIRIILQESAYAEEDYNAAVRKVNTLFTNLLNPGMRGSVTYTLSGLANVCISKGRGMVMERKGRDGAFIYNAKEGTSLAEDNEIVIIKRIALPESRPHVCEVCRKLDGLRIRADYEKANEWLAPRWCKGNWPSTGIRCRCMNIYLQKGMRPEFLEADMPDKTTDPLPAGMKTGAFSKEVECRNE